MHTCSITVVVMDRNARLVDRQLLKVGATVTVQLSVEVGEQTTLQKGILGKVNTTNDVTRLELSKSDIFSTADFSHIP